MIDRTAALLARCRFPPAATAVDCGVSGGPDSLALLVLAVDAGLDVTAVHVDHGLRPGSAREADVVAAVAKRFGARFRSEQVAVEPGPNLEARARDARHAVLGPDALLGHTADDQAETMLLALLRGSAWHGLSGMDPRRRPLLGLRRAETQALCESLDLGPIADPMNDDPAFRRVRVRHELLPLLDDIAERDLVPVLTRQAEVFADTAGLLDELAGAIDPSDARALTSQPTALARLALRAWLRDRTGSIPTLADLDRVLDVARGVSVGTEISGGHRIRRTEQVLRVEPPNNAARPLRPPC